MPVLPEIMLAIGAMVLLMIGAFRGVRRLQTLYGVAIALLLLAAVMVAYLPAGTLTTFGGSFVVDDFARFLKILALIGSAAAIAMSTDYFTAERLEVFEYPILIMLSTVGMMMLISAERPDRALSRPRADEPFALRGGGDPARLRALDRGRPEIFRPRRAVVGHAALRRSLIYGFTGTVSFDGIAKATMASTSTGLLFGLVFLFAGFCFKISAVPFHMWTPDVYEGAPTPVTAFFAAAPKVGGDGDGHPRRHRRVPRTSCRNGSRSWCSSPSPRCCSARSRRSASATSSG